MEDRRAHARIKLDLKESAEVQSEEKVPIFDISRGGACFLSVPEFEVGSLISVKSGNQTMTMKVLECRLIEVDRDLGDFRYKVRCQHVAGDIFEAEPVLEVLLQ